MTLTGKTTTSNTITLTVKESNGGATTTVNIIVLEPHYSITTGNTTKFYETFAQANAAATNGQVIKLISDYTDSTLATIDDKNITFDSNGKTLTKTSNGFIVNSGATLEITGAGTITTAENIILISNGGTLNLTHTGTISQTYTGSSRPIDNWGTLNKTGSGIITSSGKWTTIGIAGTINISNGTIGSAGEGAMHIYAQNSIVRISNNAEITGRSAFGKQYRFYYDWRNN